MALGFRLDTRGSRSCGGHRPGLLARSPAGRPGSTRRCSRLPTCRRGAASRDTPGATSTGRSGRSAASSRRGSCAARCTPCRRWTCRYVGALHNRGEWEKAWLRAFGATPVRMERLIEAIGDALDGACLTRAELIAAVTPRVGKGLAREMSSSWGTFFKPAARRGILASARARGQTLPSSAPTSGSGSASSSSATRRARSSCAAISASTARPAPRTSSSGLAPRGR